MPCLGRDLVGPVAMTDGKRMTHQPGIVPAEDRSEASPEAEGNSPSSDGSGTKIIVWALASIALLAFVALGSTPAYIWRFGRKYQELKPVLSIWTMEANNLPRVSQQWIVDSAYYAALIVFLVGVVIGLWFLLGAADHETPVSDAASPPDSGMTAA